VIAGMNKINSVLASKLAEVSGVGSLYYSANTTIVAQI
jgi:hypothetical protein